LTSFFFFCYKPTQVIGFSCGTSGPISKEDKVKTKRTVLKAVLSGMLATACLGYIALAGGQPPQEGASGYHLIKTVKLSGSGGWDYLSIDAENRKLFVSQETHIIVVHPDTGEILGEVANTPGVHGVAVAAEFGHGFTSNGDTNNVTMFDLMTLKMIDKAPTSNDPDAIIYDPASHRVFTMNGDSHSATAFDAATGKVAGTVALPGGPEFATADGHGKVFVNIETKSELAEIDSQALKVTNHWPLAPCKSPSGMAIDREHSRLFVGCDNKMMAVVDATTGKVVTTLPTGDGVDANRFDPGTGLAFSSNGESGTLTVVHEDTPDKYTVVENVKTEKGARTMEVDPKTHNVYLVTADLIPGRPHPKAKPGTFRLLIFAK
jgi:DNA-binding beta-propeller fold protein YncE